MVVNLTKNQWEDDLYTVLQHVKVFQAVEGNYRYSFEVIEDLMLLLLLLH